MRQSWIAAICLVVIFCLQAVLALPRLSPTSDEAVHLASGYSYWKTRDFRMNAEHPPLAKLIAALPLLVIQPRLNTSSDVWKKSSQYEFGFDFLYTNDTDRLLFWGRIAMIGIAALGVVITFMWARDLFGPVAGLLAAGLYAFSPNLLAHGMLITTDVPVAVFSLLTLYLFWRQGAHPNWRGSLAVGLALGAAMTCKYSGGFLPLLIVGLSLVRTLRQSNRQQALLAEIRSLMIMAGASLLVIETTYLFAAPPFAYFTNAALVNTNHSPTYEYYLLGNLKPGGWWYYFLVAFMFKATLATLILILLATARAFSGLTHRWGETILLAGIGFYVVVMTAGANDLGIRYLLPIFPLIFIWVSRIVPDYWNNRLGRAVLIVLFAWQMWAALSTFPNYIPFFNELAGGASGGPDILDDSNVDWGQGLKQAAAYVKEKGLGNITIYSFSPFDSPPHYGLPPNHLSGELAAKLLFKPPGPGTYIISAHYIARMKAVDPAWRSYQPVDRIGESLWVYRF
jgi:predicted membrane-bound dolichyl-phosphate-mannose-protein mannosyltransferase